ncbi:unnamed protein product [Mytilus coruscus]|uniref:HMCN n=1 Tax=Mytilus coruscus TaxID=42192 RepID=A0A6J8F3Z1_MYTCO|nr:unnamed protein product [Mytilus coruscus]
MQEHIVCVTLSASPNYISASVDIKLICNLDESIKNVANVTFRRNLDIIGSVKCSKLYRKYFHNYRRRNFGSCHFWDKFCCDYINNTVTWTYTPYTTPIIDETFYCEVNGDNGQDSNSTTVRPADAPENIQLSPNSTSLIIQENNRFSINCTANCRPQCQYQWTGQTYWSSSNKQLLIRYVKRKDSCSYRCAARNSVGYEYSSFVLVTVHSRPTKVKTITVKSTGSTTASIAWIPDMTVVPGQNFTLHYKTRNDIDFTSVPFKEPENRQNIYLLYVKSLIPSTEYVFKISSENYLGQTESTEVRCVTRTALVVSIRPDLVGGIALILIALLVIIITMVLVHTSLTPSGGFINTKYHLNTRYIFSETPRYNVLSRPEGRPLIGEEYENIQITATGHVVCVTLSASPNYISAFADIKLTCNVNESLENVENVTFFRNSDLLGSIVCSKWIYMRIYNTCYRGIPNCCDRSQNTVRWTFTPKATSTNDITFSCEVNGVNGQARNSTTVKPVVFPSVMVLPSSSEFQIREGQTLENITCSALCWPNCVLQWIGPNHNKEGAELILENITISKSGRYRCQAKNIIRSVYSRYITIKVQYAPFDVQLSQNSTSYIVEENKHVLINCSANCRPQCEYQWTGQTNWSSSNKQLLIRYVKKADSGSYRCSARNSLGYEYSSYVLVTVHSRPTKVKTIAAKSQGSTTASIAWIPDMSVVPRPNFTLQYKTRNDIDFTNKPFKEYENQQNIYLLHVQSLTPSTEYVFKILSENYLGRTESTEVRCVTRAEPSASIRTDLVVGISLISIALLIIIITLVLVQRFQLLTQRSGTSIGGSRCISDGTTKTDRSTNVEESLYEITNLQLLNIGSSIEASRSNNEIVQELSETPGHYLLRTPAGRNLTEKQHENIRLTATEIRRQRNKLLVQYANINTKKNKKNDYVEKKALKRSLCQSQKGRHDQPFGLLTIIQFSTSTSTSPRQNINNEDRSAVLVDLLSKLSSNFHNLQQNVISLNNKVTALTNLNLSTNSNNLNRSDNLIPTSTTPLVKSPTVLPNMINTSPVVPTIPNSTALTATHSSSKNYTIGTELQSQHTSSVNSRVYPTAAAGSEESARGFEGKQERIRSHHLLICS